MNETAREDFKTALDGLIATARENGLADEALIGELADAAEALREGLSYAALLGPARGSGLVISNYYDNLRHGKKPRSPPAPPAKRRRGRPPKPGGPIPRAEIQRAYRARLAAAGKVVR